MRSLPCLALLCVFVVFSSTCQAEDLLMRSCSELIYMAENFQHDLRAIDAVYGSAVEAGNMDRIKNYKLRKGAVRKELDGVMKAIDVKGCVKK
jgi:hypothetical protein